MNNYYHPMNNNNFVGYYVNSYDDVMNAPVPLNGSPVIFVDLSQGILWSKKMVNNQAYVQQYSIAPVVNLGEPPKPNDILEELNKLRKEMEEIKKTNKEVKNGNE